MYLKSVPFRAIFCLVVFLSTLGTASAAVIISENWDSGTPPTCWPDKSVPSSCCPTPFNGWYGRSWDCSDPGGRTGGLTTSVYHSPPRSLYISRDAGGSGYGTHVWYKDWGTHLTRVYFRAYFYFPNNWNSWDTASGCGESLEHWIYFNSAVRGGVGAYINIYDCSEWPTSGNPHCMNGSYIIGRGGDDSRFNYDAHFKDCWKIQDNLNRWVSIEVMLDQTNQKYAAWVDGVQMVGSGGQGISQAINSSSGDFFGIIITSFRSGGGGSFPITEFYVDDIVISDEYIGPIGTNSAPNPPRNVTIFGN
jgi:hypothetical protein